MPRDAHSDVIGAAPSEKLQKVLARTGIASRRELERWIAAGRVSVNGSTAALGHRVTEADVIRVDGRRLPQREPRRTRVLCYHKQAGEICTRHDPAGRQTVFSRLPPLKDGRWVSVGRLDFTTSGLLLFTDNGELAHRLMHPSSSIEREYAVRVTGEVTPAIVAKLTSGVMLEDGVGHFLSVRHSGGAGSNQWFHVTLAEGRTREVRRLWESQGLRVSRLTRVRFGPIPLGRDLRATHWRELSTSNTAQLLKLVGLRARRETRIRRPGGHSKTTSPRRRKRQAH